ncbi:MAG: class I SAM-dependent methyltransferase [Patescibacteria group bacterium]|nr:class I SAM-dependent methyltransferase [Patescibacteria group bacterium]
MKPSTYQKRKQKWEKKNREIISSANSSREATFILTTKNTLELLEDKRRGRVLDIGCGFGEIDILLAQNTDFNIIGCDISEIAVKTARENVKKAGLTQRIKIEEGDVYSLKYPNDFFDIGISFGYVSAATYPGVQKEIARVLKPGGILICDFINCLSFYKFLPTLKRVIKGQKIPYYIFLAGIRRKFEKEGLIFVDQRLFNTYPPIDLKLSPKVFLTFENTIGKIFKNFLGRVRLVKFQKIKS